MHIKALIQTLTVTSYIVCESIETDAAGTINLQHIRIEKVNTAAEFAEKTPRYDNGGGTRKWRCLDTGEAKAYVVAEAPRVCCKEHGVVTAFVPWARHKSRFCSSFEDTVAWLAVNSTKKCVAELMRIEWHTVGEILSRVYKELEKKPSKRFDNLVNIGIDETSYKKGHKYMTVVTVFIVSSRDVINAVFVHVADFFST